jgi:hypothetical protein
MASCSYCNTTILFGGKRTGDLRFCDEKCAQKGALALVANQLSPAEVATYIYRVHRGRCPKCSGPGPVDVHTSYRVWSALVMTSWSSRPLVACKSCGTRQKLGDTAFSLFLGWWGFPWGIVMTPVQLVRNIFTLLKASDPNSPSPALEKILRLHLAAQLVEHQHQEPAAANSFSSTY